MLQRDLTNDFVLLLVKLSFSLDATSSIAQSSSQSAPHTGAHLMQPSSEACEAEDRCFRVAVARKLMLPHPAVADPSGVALTCSMKSATGQICGKPVDTQKHHCYGCRYGRGVDRRHAAVARCLADVIHSHSGTKVYLEQGIPTRTRVVNGQTEHVRMNLVFNHNGSTKYLDVAIVSPSSSSPALIAAASTRPGHMAKRAEKVSTHQPCPFHPRDHGPPQTPRQKVHQQPHERRRQPTTCHPRYLVSHPECPSQRHFQTTTHSYSRVALLYGSFMREHLVPPKRESCVTLGPLFPQPLLSCLFPACLSAPSVSTVLTGTPTEVSSVKLDPALPCGPAVMTLHPTTTNTTPATAFYSCWLTPT